MQETNQTKWETILGQVPSKSNSYLAVPDSEGGRRIIKNERVREYERNFAKQCRVYRNKYRSRPFKLLLKVFESSVRYDLDGAFKAILDCLQYSKAIKDDNLCVEIKAEKKIDKSQPRIEYALIELEPTLSLF